MAFRHSRACRASVTGSKPPGLDVARATLAFPFNLTLKELSLSLVPGSQARKGVGPALLVNPCQRGQHDGHEGHPFIEAAASQHMTQRSQHKQSQSRLSPRT